MKLSILVLFLVQLGYAIPNTNSHNSFESWLQLPHKLAMRSFASQQGEAVVFLQKTAFNSKNNMSTRWKAFMLLSQLTGSKTHKHIDKALQSKTWYMRSAALVSLAEFDVLSVKKPAMRLLSDDPSLLVRLKAAELLSAQMDESVINLFWKKVYSPDSYHRHKSLWIRHELVSSLLVEPRTKDLDKWIQLLKEKDGDLLKMATLALKKMNKDTNPQSLQTAYWQQKYKQRLQ